MSETTGGFEATRMSGNIQGQVVEILVRGDRGVWKYTLPYEAFRAQYQEELVEGFQRKYDVKCTPRGPAVFHFQDRQHEAIGTRNYIGGSIGPFMPRIPISETARLELNPITRHHIDKARLIELSKTHCKQEIAQITGFSVQGILMACKRWNVKPIKGKTGPKPHKRERE